MFRNCLREIQWTIISPKFYIGILIGSVSCVIDSVNLIKFSEYLNEPLNIFDSSIYSLSNQFSMTLFFLGAIFILSSIPFSGNDEIYFLLRTSKKKWFINKVVYIFLICFIYSLIIVIIEMLIISSKSYFSSAWSDALYTMSVTNPNLSNGLFGLYFKAPHVLVNLSPILAFVLSFILAYVYICLMSLFLFYLNIRLPKNLGVIFTILIHSIGYIIEFGLKKYVIISLFSNSLLLEHNFNNNYDLPNYPYLKFSFSAFMILALLLILVSFKNIKKIDFSGIREKN